MHPRNPYRHLQDFHSLAEFFPSLKPYLSLSFTGKHSLDFRDPNAQRALTQALLKRDFNIALSIPEHRLCPPVPNRLNYVLWVQDILFPYDEIDPEEEIKGLDIGTGASAIYPLLACSLPNTRNWTFVGTENDSLSADFASRNVEANNLQSRITIYKIANVDPETEDSRPTLILAPLVEDVSSFFDVTMCNPPFYRSAAEIKSSADAKDLPPIAICTGAETEMITPGGETAFVLQMLQESAQEEVRSRCRWYTSMLGKLTSVGEVVGELRRLNIDNYALTQFVQGTTRRWAVAWSFTDERLPDTIARPSSSSISSYLPAPTSLRQTFTLPRDKNDIDVRTNVVLCRVKSVLFDVLHAIEGVAFHSVYTDKGKDRPSVRADGIWKYVVTAFENTWSRAARRKRKRSSSSSPSSNFVGKTPPLTQNRTSSHTSIPPSPSGEITSIPAPISDLRHPPALQCWISVLDSPSPAYSSHPQYDARTAGSMTFTLEAQWTRGKERKLFEGFWSHVCRKVADKLGNLFPATGGSEGGIPSA